MSAVFQTVNPSTGKEVKSFPFATDEEIRAAIDLAHDTFQQWRRRPIAERASLLLKVAGLLMERREQLAQIVTLEIGKPIGEARDEIGLCAMITKYFADNGEEMLKPKPMEQGSVVISEPLGVILAIEPWNFPFYQAFRVIAPHILAGNVVILKHAPSCPQSALAIAQLFKDVGMDGVYINVFATVSQAHTIIEDFRVRGVTFTGSELAAAAVAEKAGRHLKKVVLECGGSDPFIILPDAPLPHAIGQARAGRMYNTGQSCTAAKRIIVVGRERGKEFLSGYKDALKEMKAGDPTDGATTLGPVVTERALENLLKQIDDAKSHGAKVALGGQRIDRPGFYLEPTIITDISAKNPLFHEETFGPVASLYVVDTEEEAIELANATNFGLGASIFSADLEHAQELARRIDSGMVFINSMFYSGPEVPFGGVKNSGIGRELSEFGIGEFVNKKLVRVADHAAKSIAQL